MTAQLDRPMREEALATGPAVARLKRVVKRYGEQKDIWTALISQSAPATSRSS